MHTHTHTVLHTHILVSLFWPTGPFQPNRPFLFLVVSAKTWSWSCSVSVCRRLWVPSCMFLPPSISFSLSLCLSFGPSCSLPSSLSLSLLLSFFFAFSSLSFSLSSSLELFLSFSPSPSSVLIEVQYYMLADCCPSLSPIMMVACCSIPLSMSAAEHGRPRLLHYITVSACCCRA